MSTKELHNIGEFRAYPSNLEVLTPDGVATVSLDGLIHTMTPEEAREFADEAADRIGIPADCDNRDSLVRYVAGRCDVTNAPDYAGLYYVARIRSFYGPREDLAILEDETSSMGQREVFVSASDAHEYVEQLNSARYVLASGEASRPEYLVVDQVTVDWLDWDDCGKYDWDMYDGDEGDEDAEHAYMRARDIEYVRAHAVGIE